MQTTHIILVALIILGIGIAHYHYRERVGLAPNEVRICTSENDCHHVNATLAQAVLDKAHAIAQADEAEAFPIDATDDLDTVYVMDVESLEAIRIAVTKELQIDAERVPNNPYFDQQKTVNELILFLHIQQQNQPVG